MTATALEPTRSATLTGAKYFYVWMAGLCMLVAFVGFAPTYWVPVATGTFLGAPIFHIHGLLFSFWTVFFVAQTALAGSGRIARHRAVGLIGVALATSMVIVGLLAALVSLRHSIALGFGESAKAFSIVPVTGIFVFAGLFIAAVANVRRPEVPADAGHDEFVAECSHWASVPSVPGSGGGARASARGRSPASRGVHRWAGARE